jgi:hypothetical protein
MHGKSITCFTRSFLKHYLLLEAGAIDSIKKAMYVNAIYKIQTIQILSKSAGNLLSNQKKINY